MSVRIINEASFNLSSLFSCSAYCVVWTLLTQYTYTTKEQKKTKTHNTRKHYSNDDRMTLIKRRRNETEMECSWVNRIDDIEQGERYLYALFKYSWHFDIAALEHVDLKQAKRKQPKFDELSAVCDKWFLVDFNSIFFLEKPSEETLTSFVYQNTEVQLDSINENNFSWGFCMISS